MASVAKTGNCPQMYAMKNFHFETDRKKDEEQWKWCGKIGIAMCTVCASVCVSAVNGFECGQRKAEKFRKVPIKDKPMEMDAFCSSLASPFRRRVGLTNGGAEWREVPAKDTSESGKKVSTASNRVIPSGCV